MRRIFSLVAALLAIVALVQAAPAINDNVDVKIEQWMTPSNPAYPHDPAVAPDGSVWYTGQRANVIGRFDPATEQFKEFTLPTPNSGPHGLQADKDGNIWYTGNAAGLIGKVDPKTGKVEEFQSPGGAESRPYAIDVTADGAIWYVETGDDAKNMLVRFNPETKKFLTWEIPGGGGTVRNMEIDRNGDLWLAESGV